MRRLFISFNFCRYFSVSPPNTVNIKVCGPTILGVAKMSGGRVTVYVSFSCVNAIVEREIGPDGTVKSELYEISGMPEKVKLTYGGKNELSVEIVEKDDIEYDDEAVVNELFSAVLNDNEKAKIYEIPTEFGSAYFVTREVNGEPKNIVSAGTDFADVVKEASRKLNVPLDRYLAEYLENITRKLTS